jgi:hypothetical protein
MMRMMNENGMALTPSSFGKCQPNLALLCSYCKDYRELNVDRSDASPLLNIIVIDSTQNLHTGALVLTETNW